MDKDQSRVENPPAVSSTPGFIPFDDLMKQQGVAPGEPPKEDFRTLDAVMKDIPKPEPKGKVHPLADDIHAKNRYLAGRQFTVPDVDQHRRNYLGDAHAYFPEDDDPTASITKEPIEFGKGYNPGSTTLYKDEDGKWTKFNPDKHVALFDEQDGKAKIFKRTPDTDYGPITGRLFGLASILGDSIHLSPITSAIGGGTKLVDKLTRTGTVAKGGEKALLDPSVPAATKLFAGPEGSRVPMTAGQKAAESVENIKGAVGVEVPVSRAQVAGPVESKIGAAVAHIPGGSSPFVNAASKTTEGAEQAINAAAASAAKGTPANVAEAGDTAKSTITNYIAPSSQGGKLAAQVDKAYAKVDPLVSPTATQPLTETMKAAIQVQQEWQAATKSPGISPVVQKIAHAVTDPAGSTYEGIKRLRSEIGEAIRTGSFRDQALSNMEKGDLKRIHTGLTEDLRTLIESTGGKKAVALWEKANDLSQARAEKVKQLSTIIGSDTRSEEKIYQTIVNMAGSTGSADIKKLALARKSMGAVAWRDVSSAAINEMGYVRTGNDRVFTIDKFMKDYGKFSDAGKNILFGENTPHRIALDNLVKIGESWPKMKDVTSPSGELTHLFTFGAMFHHFGKALMVMGASKTAGSVLARPVTADGTARWLQSYKVFTLKPSRANAEIFTQATRRLGEDLAKEDEGYTSKGSAKVDKFYNYIMDQTGVSKWWQDRKNEVNDK